MRAGQKIELVAQNEWALASEFASAPLHRENVVPGGHAAEILLQAGLLPTINPLPKESIVGRMLGHVATPAGIQIIVYLATRAVVGLAKPLLPRANRPAAKNAAIAAVVLSSLAPLPAQAELQIRLPTVEYRELEFEHNGFFTFDKDRTLGGQQSYTNSIGYGLTPWWKVELEGETNSVPDTSVHYTATTMENTFQITPPGKYWLNLGAFVEYSQSALNGEPNSFTFGPIVQKELYNTLGVDSLHTLNVFIERDVGHNATHATGLQVAWQSRLLLNPYIDPAIEYYGFIDDLGNAGKFSQQQHFIGPVGLGAVSFSPYGKLKYEVGYMFGMTPATPRGAVRWKLEYEIAF